MAEWIEEAIAVVHDHDEESENDLNDDEMCEGEYRFRNLFLKHLKYCTFIILKYFNHLRYKVKILFSRNEY